MRAVAASINDEDTPVEPGALTQKGWNFCIAVTDPNLFDTGNLSSGDRPSHCCQKMSTHGRGGMC